MVYFSLDYTVDEKPSEMVLIQELESGRAKPLVFVLNANLLALVKLVNCMFPSVCWIKMSQIRLTASLLYRFKNNPDQNKVNISNPTKMGTKMGPTSSSNPEFSDNLPQWIYCS